MIEKRKVTINGVVAEVGARVKAGDKIRANGALVENERERVYIALNKPIGIVSTTDPKEKDNIEKFVNYPHRIFNIGRLDKDSEGLILLTNDGSIVNKILRSSNDHEKEYEVVVDKPVTDRFIKGMEGGVPILGTTTKKCKVVREGAMAFRIILTQGLNRQIRRMCEHFGYEVVRLRRVRIMNIELGKMHVGHWRELSDKEIAALTADLKDSDGTEAASKGVGRVKHRHKHHPFYSKTAQRQREAEKEQSKDSEKSKQGGRGTRGSAKSAKSTRSAGSARPTASRGGGSKSPSSSRAQGSKPQGSRPQGSKPQGSKPQGSRSPKPQSSKRSSKPKR